MVDICPNCGDEESSIECPLCGDVVCPKCTREGISYEIICANCVGVEEEDETNDE